MSSVIKSIPLSACGTDLHKETSTSGIIYTLSKTRNSVLPLTEVIANTLVISIENTSELVAILRGQSKEDGIKFQLPLGANEIRKVYLPFAPDYLLSTTQNLKISDVSTLQTYLPNTQDFDSVETPSSVFQVSANPTPAYKKGLGYQLFGLTNIYIKQALTARDFIIIESEGSPVVWRFGELRLSVDGEFIYVVPANEIPQTIACGSEKPYTLQMSSHQKKYVNPAYVAPEAELWSLENSIAHLTK